MTNYNQSSWTKGEQFENFVQNEIFPKSHYELLHKTSDFRQNSQRYVTTSLKPDFQFKCKVTGSIFYVEAKFRSKAFKDKYDVLSEKQFKSFPSLNSPDCPIFIAFGYGGDAASPDFLSLIPLTVVKSKSLTPEEVLQYRIKKEIYPSRRFDIKQKGTTQENKAQLNKETVNEPISEKDIREALENQEQKTSTKKIMPLYAWAGAGLVAILLILFSLSFSADAAETNITPEERFKEIVDNYYRSMNSNQIEKLPEFLSPKVDHWYGDENPTQEQIIRNAESHRGKYPYSASEINWKTLRVIEREEGDFRVSYEMTYKSKQKITDDYNVYELRLITEWDENFKLKSIREIKL